MNIDIQKLEAITSSLGIWFTDGDIKQTISVDGGKPIYFSSSVEDYSENLPGGSCGENMRAAYASHENPYEPLITAFFYLNREEIQELNMIDVGALWGHTSLVAASLFPRCNIHLFEMNPITTQVLSKNILLNQHLGGSFQVNNILLSNVDRTTQVTFRHYTASYGDGSEGAKLSQRKIFRENLKSALKRVLKRKGQGDYITLEMQVGTLDDYCRKNSFIPNLIKIDVEGSQYNILQGARQVLVQHHPLLLVEFDEPDSANNIGKSNRDTVRLLESLGYQCIWGNHRDRNTHLHQIDGNTELNIETNSLGIFSSTTKHFE